jgi:microcystin-dependent protein
MSSVLRSYKIPQAITVYNHGQVGDMKTSAAMVDHGGWLICDGRALDVSEYYMLYKMVGYAFGTADGGNKFLLPNPQGRVPGYVGTLSGNTWAMGDVSGSYTHTLTIPELPKHNHSVDGSNNTLGLTDVSGEHVHSIYDPGHNHTYINQPNTHDVAVSLTTTDTADNVNITQPTGNSPTGITINSNGAHAHNIQSRGDNLPHNNIQPTLFVGNMFIYTGVNKYYVANS